MSDLGALFRADSWNFPGLKDGQILRTISNITTSDIHYASDDDKAGPSLADTQTACTVSVPGSSRLSDAHKDAMSPPKMLPPSGGKKRPVQAPPTFDIIAHAGLLPGKDPLQHFPLPERSGLFADMLSHLEASTGGDTVSPKLMNVQLHNLGHLFDDLDKAGSDVSECPETPLHLFPNTPTSELLLQGQLSQFFPEAQTPPQTTPSPPLRGSSRYGGQASQAPSYEGGGGGAAASPMSPLVSDARAHSMPSPLQAAYGLVHRGEPSSKMKHRAYSSPLPPLLEPFSFPPPVRTGRPSGVSPRPSPARPAGVRKAGQQPRAKAAGRRTMSLSMASDFERAASLRSEDAGSSGGNTDSEGDSLVTDGGSSKRKQGGRKGGGRRARRMTCRNCATHQTPQWRCGPEGPRTLCNACGVRFKKGLPLNGWPGRAAIAAAAAAAGGGGGAAGASPLQNSLLD